MSGSIYFLQVDGDGPIKIGFTDGLVSSRVAAIQQASPYVLHWIGYFQGIKAEEAAAHNLLHGSRLRNEWFHPTLEVRSFIKEKCPRFDKSEYLNEVFLDEYRSKVKLALHRRRNSYDDFSAIAFAGGLNRYDLHKWLTGARVLPPEIAKSCAHRADKILS